MAASAVLPEGAFTVTLDGKPVRTPKKAPLALPTARLADAVAAEWLAQGEDIAPATMPLTKLANTTIDWVSGERVRVEEVVAGYAASDLICYRAESPDELVARQHDVWQPLVEWIEERYAARLRVARGIVFAEQDDAARRALTAAVVAHDDPGLMALHDASTITGSLAIGLALIGGRIDVATAWSAARVDEDFQAERWGLDAEAEQQAASMRADLDCAMRFFSLSRA